MYGKMRIRGKFPYFTYEHYKLHLISKICNVFEAAGDTKGLLLQVKMGMLILMFLQKNYMLL